MIKMTMRNTLCALVAATVMAVGCAKPDVPPQPPKSEPNYVENIRWNGAEYRANFSDGGALESVIPSDFETHRPDDFNCYFPQGQEASCQGYLHKIPLSAQSEAAIRSYIQAVRDTEYNLKLDAYNASQAAKQAK